MRNLKLPAKIENLNSLIKFIAECAARQGFASEEIRKIELAAEEAIVNICRYAYPSCSGEVEVNCGEDESGSVIEIADSGIPFDCHSVPCPDVNANLENRKMGGLGIYLMTRVMDEVRYRRERDRNILTLIYRPRTGQRRERNR